MLCLGSTAYSAPAAPRPPNWPWRGISIDSFGGGNDVGEIDFLAGLGVNAVQLNLSMRSTAEYEHMSPEAAWRKNVEWADLMLDACAKHGMVGIVSLFQFPLDPTLSLNQESPGFWDAPAQLDQATGQVAALADHFKRRGREFAAYDILSEPLVVRSSGQEIPAQWAALRNRIIDEIQRRDPNRFIVISPGPGAEASGYRTFIPLAKARIIYTAHVYNPHSYTHQGIGRRTLGCIYPGYCAGTLWNSAQLRNNLAPVLEFRNKFRALVWIGEFSAVRWAKGSERYISDLIYLFDSNTLGWSYYSLNSWHGWNPSYNDQYGTDHPAVWESQYVGTETLRWGILKNAFSKNVR